MQSGALSTAAGATLPITDCWYLTGLTASGKTSVGLILAERLNAEIISLDSMTVYRGMDIGTAKPSVSQRRQVAHHLIDVRDPDEEFTLSEYLEAAHAAWRAIRARGREVLFVGGTPLYLKSLLRGVFRGPPADWEFRQQIEDELATVGLEALHQRLEQVDPLSAARLHPHDKRRIIRALEVYRQTGQPISHLQVQFEEGLPAERCRVFGLHLPRPALHARIHARVDRMFAQGLEDEVRGLVARYGSFSRTARQAVGYREVLAYLDGRGDRATAIEAIKSRTRQFARRQETWFRSLSEFRMVERQPEDSEVAIVQRVLEMGRAGC